jgi:hypothetical protein
MNNEQHYLQTLFNSMDQGFFPTDEMRSAFQRITERLRDAPDLEAELRSLYRVENFAEFALSLLWISRQVRRDPLKAEPTDEERGLLMSRFPVLSGGMAAEPLPPEITTSVEPGAPWAGPQASEETPPAEPETPWPAAEPSGEIPAAEPGAPSETPAPAGEGISPGEFALLMERFVEAMQGGDEERTVLMDRMLGAARGNSAEGSGADEELREYCSLLVVFLDYVEENQYMDDVRVMNILSNISGPVSGWAAAAPAERTGQLADGIEVLRNFKSMFE